MMSINAGVDTLSLIFHIYWVEVIDNAIVNPVLQKYTELNISHLDSRSFTIILFILN